MSKAKPFILDLGVRQVCVELAELQDKLGYALLKKNRIILDPTQDGQEIGASLWHEVLHHIDDLYFGARLFGDDDKDPEHPKLDAFSNILDMILDKNWNVFKQLYGKR